MSEKYYRLSKVIIAFLVVIVAFLYALSSRYYVSEGGHRIHDKWTNKTYENKDGRYEMYKWNND